MCEYFYFSIKKIFLEGEKAEGGAEGERENLKQTAGSAWTDTGFDPMTLRS